MATMPGISAATWGIIAQPWTEVAEPLARRVADLAGLQRGQDVLSIGGGEARFAVWAVERYQVQVEVVDPDRAAVARGELAAAHLPLRARPRLQVAEPADLPHESGVFDAAVVDLLTLGSANPARVLAEAGRVVRSYGTLVGLLPVWHEPPTPGVQELLAGRLGVMPHLLVEWKRWMREAGLVDLLAEEPPDGQWTLESRASAVVRGWRVAGLPGVLAALSPAATVFWREVRARRLDLALLRGVRWPNSHS